MDTSRIQAPPGGFQYGAWYWNPVIGQAQRYAGNGSFLPPGQTQLPGEGQPAPATSTTTSAKVPTAEDILKPVQDQLKEQTTFLKDFLDKNPLAFDEVLARQMAQDKYQPYYQQVLNDFVQPLQDKIARSQQDETAVLGELVRQRTVGQRDITTTTDQAVQRAKEGFAGAGLLGSGIQSGVTARANIAGTNKLNDFLAGNTYQQNQTQTEAQRTQADAQTAITKENRDIFGAGQQYDTAIAKDVEAARGTALNQRALSTLTAYSDRFGAPSSGISDFLKLYNQ